MASQVRREEIDSYKTTIRRMFEFTRRYVDDLRPFARMNLFEFYEYVRELEYRPDSIPFPAWARVGLEDIKHAERLSRPRYTLSPLWDGPRDCDDKAILIGTFCRMIGVPFRFVACGRKIVLDLLPLSAPLSVKPSGVHHVYPEVKLPVSGWVPADPTYPDRSRFGVRLYEEDKRVVFHDAA